MEQGNCATARMKNTSRSELQQCPAAALFVPAMIRLSPGQLYRVSVPAVRQIDELGTAFS
ncbi:hypothetical protein EMEDMD4_970010 [Sinorhizobium medicae]|uniref:Uncharacterized protein n=1 Tax=Sinorhizobium medicae TaxID=110321 RepID=A0A508X8S8_9HYPH|nr:hypothetical protein EMEDMD4_970010 [Sinorhizobium medicae]